MLENKDYCDYETCVALRELGCQLTSKEVRYEDKAVFVPGVLLYSAQKWLREVKGIIVYPVSIGDLQHQKWYAKLEYMDFYCYPICDTYEEALSEGIKEAVKILKDGIGE